MFHPSIFLATSSASFGVGVFRTGKGNYHYLPEPTSAALKEVPN
jgi:hypothetical protein